MADTVTARVPEHTSAKPDKDGQFFAYGGYAVTLQTCALDGNLYADAEQHASTPAHKAAKQ